MQDLSASFQMLFRMVTTDLMICEINHVSQRLRSFRISQKRRQALSLLLRSANNPVPTGSRDVCERVWDRDTATVDIVVGCTERKGQLEEK